VFELTARIDKTDDEWKEALTPEQYRVLRGKGTEMPFTGPLLDTKAKGVYVCAGCGRELFRSESKFNSGTGWPSFYAVVSEDAVEERPDESLFMKRTEILCARCGGHLGHVFDDGPDPTGKRYCVNSAALRFEPSE
jgi:peptide-methionine (R)-S-oxide reductase